MGDCEYSVNIHDHGKAVPRTKGKVQCNYCGKIVSGLFRLRCHLGGVRGDVKPCLDVPANIKESFRTILHESKRGSLARDNIRNNLHNQNLPWKRNRSPFSSNVKHEKDGGPPTVDCKDEAPHQALDSSNKGPADSNTAKMGETKSSSPSMHLQKCIGRFFYGTGLDFSAINSPGFKRMMDAAIVHGHVECRTPTSEDLKGWLLEEELKDVQEYVNKIRQSSDTTGCSILLDAWNDEKGRSLVNFLVNCPQGSIYLRSADVSDILDDVDVLQFLLDEVLEEVGVQNVIQIVASSSVGWMASVGNCFMDQCRSAFWTVSASHCIELMLENIGRIDSIKGILDKAKTIVKFVHGHSMVLQLLKKHTSCEALTKPSKIRSIIPYTTLENIVANRQKLDEMLTSSQWTALSWASAMEGKMVTDLVGDDSFWMVLKWS